MTNSLACWYSSAVRAMLISFTENLMLPSRPRLISSGVKDTEPEDLIQAVRIVARGDALLSPGITRRLIADIAAKGRPDRDATTYRTDRLTEREGEVLALVGRGLSNDEIAGTLFLSPLTVKTHVSRIMHKLAARDRAQLVIIAYETGLVTVGGPEATAPGPAAQH
jgi:DNA-binding NarL/FixJ family response regulator